MNERDEYFLLKKYGLETRVSLAVEFAELPYLPIAMRRAELGEAYLFIEYIEHEERIRMDNIRRKLDYQRGLLYVKR